MSVTFTFWNVYASVLALLLIGVFIFGGRERIGPLGWPDPTPSAAWSWSLFLAWAFIGVIAGIARALP